MATAYQQPWEQILLSLAYEAEHQSLAPSNLWVNDRRILDRAYACCDSITSTNSRTFYMATGLLPADKRRAMRALYAFCRLSDDIVDCSESDAEESLAAWRRRALTSEPSSCDLVTIAWADTRFRYQIPQRYAEQLIDNIVYRSWSQLQVLGENFEKTLDLHEYRYNMIRGIDFYNYARQTISECPHVEFLQGRVELIKDGDQQANVLVDGNQYTGTWVFDSLFDWSAFKPDPTHYHAIKQQFKGWEIAAAGQPFNPQVATLLDFRTPQKNGTHFFYVLPFSEQRALVESVLCTTTPVNWELCEQALQVYLKSILGIKAYKILREEQGINPLTDWRFPRQLGKHIMAIGNHGGMVKPSTGYAFLRMQEDSSTITNSLLKVGHPFSLPASPRRYRYFDAVMLEIMAHHAERIEPILTSLFKRNPIERIFRFLDEIAPPGENLMMIPSLPPQLLFQAFLQLGALRRV